MGIFGKKSAKADKKAENKGDKKAPAKAEAKASDKKADDKKPAKAKKFTRTVVRQDASDAYRVVVAPVLTEKSERLQAIGKYTFAVAKDANKVEIARAIREIYGVTPKDVTVQVNKGKKVRFGRYTGKRKDTKKAIVTLPEGEILNVMEV